MALSENLSSSQSRPEITEKCGVFGTFTPGQDSAPTTLHGIKNLQHRGQDAAGIASIEGKTIYESRATGLVEKVFPNGEKDVEDLLGEISVGHTRYGTSFSESQGNSHLQPVIGTENILFAHNGNLPDTRELTEFLKDKGVSTNKLNDSEQMHAALEYYLRKGAPIQDALLETLPLYKGAFSLVIANENSLIGLRDPWGMRPLSLGISKDNVSFASETNALQNYDETKEINPGEILIFNGNELVSLNYNDKEPKFDIFEILYLMNPESQVYGQKIENIRENLGRKLAEELQNEPPLDLDVIVGTPNTALPAAKGLAEGLDLNMEYGLIKRPRANRTFIASDFTERDKLVRDKLYANPSVIRGRNIGLVDDTIVRGTTTRVTVSMLKEAGANSVHLLIPSAPIQNPDFYGVNTPYQDQLIANQFDSPEELAEALGADSIHYLSAEGMTEATGIPAEKLSVSAFTGEYPIDLGNRREEVSKVKPLRLHSGRPFVLSS